MNSTRKSLRTEREFGFVVGGVLILLTFARRKSRQPIAGGSPLSPTEEARLKQVLDGRQQT